MIHWQAVMIGGLVLYAGIVLVCGIAAGRVIRAGSAHLPPEGKDQ